MIAWWNTLTLFQQIAAAIAAPATLIVILQLIMILFGFSTDDSLDSSPDLDSSDFSVDPFNDESIFNLGNLKIISFRGIIAFLSVGGWVAMAMSYSTNNIIATIVGAVAGIAIALLIAITMKYAMKLQTSGNINYANAIGKNATVYIRIPAKRSSKGKVTLTLQERFVEVDAVSDEDERIDTGSMVKITALENENTVIVERIK